MIFNSLHCIDRLEAVYLANMYFDEISDAALSSVIQHNTNLKVLYLNIYFNFLQETEIKSVTALRSIANLMVLYFSNCNTSCSHDITGAISLAIRSNSAQQKLYLCSNKLDTRALKIIAALKNLSNLNLLDLSDNDMSDVIATELAFVIAKNSSLEVLRLSSNRLTKFSVIAIAKSLSRISTLKVFDIRTNLVNEEAADSIASVVQTNAGLEELYLGYNKLRAGALKIVRALKELSHFKVLDLNNNSTSDIVADELVAIIDHNSL